MDVFFRKKVTFILKILALGIIHDSAGGFFNGMRWSSWHVCDYILFRVLIITGFLKHIY